MKSNEWKILVAKRFQGGILGTAPFIFLLHQKFSMFSREFAAKMPKMQNFQGYLNSLYQKNFVYVSINDP